MEAKVIPNSPADKSKPRLLDQLREVLLFKHYSIRPERCYVDWIRGFILFHGKRHPASMGAEEIRGFLTHLASAGGVAASTTAFACGDAAGLRDARAANAERRTPSRAETAEGAEAGRQLIRLTRDLPSSRTVY